MDKRILLIDDNEVDLFINRRILEMAGIKDKICEFHSAIDALEFLQSQRCNSEMEIMILLDLTMPEMDGFSFLSAYGQMMGTLKANTTVVVLSSSTNQNDITNALSYPLVQKFVVKPLTLNKAQAIFNRERSNVVIN